MIALVRYMSTVLLLSQRYLAPLLLFLGLVAVLTSSDTGPLTATYASVAGALLPCSVWLTTALVGLEDQPHRSIVVVSAGSRLRVLLATVGTATLWCLLLTAAGLVLPLMLGAHSPAPADLVLGTAAQLTCAFTGMAVGLVCSRLVFRRQGYALVLALLLLLAVLLGDGVSPVRTMLTHLQDAPDSSAALVPTSLMLAAATGLLATAAAVTQAITRRKA
ncbi:hypothetical protein [Streptomyces roseolilacinus]|uniref:ABC transporter n=1 Tax=Streptomyces roseolilacinus TaxID=66904 RepID=A0A918AXF7_9ACTN|nr:hypothetical protein [Streptomyces roseolilacinus]GGP97221.1 hypothetical protein GCM10010249_14540 [Streptomyces roseolilacinus]